MTFQPPPVSVCWHRIPKSGHPADHPCHLGCVLIADQSPGAHPIEGLLRHLHVDVPTERGETATVTVRWYRGGDTYGVHLTGTLLEAPPPCRWRS